MFDDTNTGPGEALDEVPEKPVGDTRWLGLLGTVGDGELIPRWHGVWAYDFASQRARTAFVGLNLLLSLAMAILSWVKHGGRNVAADPRQAFVDGLNAGRSEAFDELPGEIKREHEMAVARYEQARKMATLYSPHVALRSEMIALINALERYRANNEPLPSALGARIRTFVARAKGVYREAHMPIDGDLISVPPTAEAKPDVPAADLP